MSVDNTMPVLVVGDYETMRRIIRNLLKQLGFEQVDEAAGGGEALDMMRQKSFGLVIADWNIEPMTGLELLEQARADGLLKHIPFILATSESRPEALAAARQAGLSDYIVKPFDASALKVKMAAVMGERVPAA